MLLCVLESHKELPSPQRDVLCAGKQEKRGEAGNRLPPGRASHLPVPVSSPVVF